MSLPILRTYVANNNTSTIESQSKSQFEKLLRYAYSIDNQCIYEERVRIRSNKKVLKMLKLKDLRRSMNCCNTDDLLEWDKSSSTSTHGNECANEFWDKVLNVAIKRYLSQLLTLVEVVGTNTRGMCEFDLLVIPVSDQSSYGVQELYELWINNNLQGFDRRWEDAQRWIQICRRSDQPENEIVERLNEFLLNLNYLAQEGSVAANVDRLRGAGVFMLEVDAPPRNLRMQKWILYRLLHKIPSLRSSRLNVHSINLNFNNMMHGSETTFEDLFSRDSKLDSICDAMLRSKPVLFTICGMENLRPNKLDLFMGVFLKDLNTEIAKYSNVSGNKCIVILIGRSGWTSNHSQCSIYSPPISWGDLNDDDIDNWLLTQPERENVTAREFLDEAAIVRQYRYNEESLPSDTVNWRAWINIGSPDITVSSICNNFLGVDGINRLNNIWSKVA
jgi:hypothetical protein